MFADDTALFYEASTKELLERKINNDLIQVSKWLIANKLSLNVAKSNFIVFGQKNNLSLSVLLNNNIISQKESVKYLGIFLDSKLNWNFHISHVKNRLSSAIAIIYKLRNFVNINIMRDIYYSYVYSNILYGIELWGAANKNSLIGISKLMNKAVRAMHFKGKKDEVEPLYNQSGFLLLDNIKKLRWGCMIKNVCLGNSPLNFQENMFPLISHDYNTRCNNDKLKTPFFSLKSSRASIFYSGINFWNSNFIETNNISAYKHDLKKKLQELQLNNYGLD